MAQYYYNDGAYFENADYDYRPRRRRKRRRINSDILFLMVMAVLFVILFFMCRGIYHMLHKADGTSAQTVQTMAPDEDNSELTDEEKLNYILSNSGAYPTVLQELAQKNSDTIDYVYQYPFVDSTTSASLTDEELSGGIPLLLQWDSRWGYFSYGSGLLGYTGCGPTCLSMVAVGLTGDATATPAAVASYAEQNGYYASGTGTTWALMSEGCQHYGLQAEELPLSEQKMAAALSAGQPIIASMGPGDFTDNGHFIVITGYDDGAFTIHDPNSIQRSNRTWSYDELQKQIKNLWAYSAMRN